MKRSNGDPHLTGGVFVRLPENVQDFLLSAIRPGDIQVMQGNLHEAAHTFWQLLRDAAEEISMTAHLRLCDIYREWNDLTRAVDHWQQAMLLVERSGQGGFASVEFSLLAARLAWARGEREEVMVWLEEAEESSRYFGEYAAYLAQIAAYRVQFSLSQGDLASASRWGEQDTFAEEAMSLYGEDICYLMRARLGIAQRRPQEAIVLLEKMLQVIQSQGRVGSEIAVLILLALAYHAQGKRLQALRILERAITLAEPGGYIRIFVDEGPVMARLFTEYYNRIQQRTLREQQAFPLAYIRTVLAAFGRAAQPAIWSIPQQGEDVLIEKLSEREQEVLALIAAGLSNQEIAQRLVVTVSTIKTHLNNIYTKLHVHTRLQAVTRAHNVGMLRRSEVDSEPATRSKTPARAR